jgi:hypothetical protein
MWNVPHFISTVDFGLLPGNSDRQYIKQKCGTFHTQIGIPAIRNPQSNVVRSTLYIWAVFSFEWAVK